MTRPLGEALRSASSTPSTPPVNKVANLKAAVDKLTSCMPTAVSQAAKGRIILQLPATTTEVECLSILTKDDYYFARSLRNWLIDEKLDVQCVGSKVVLTPMCRDASSDTVHAIDKSNITDEAIVSDMPNKEDDKFPSSNANLDNLFNKMTGVLTKVAIWTTAISTPLSLLVLIAYLRKSHASLPIFDNSIAGVLPILSFAALFVFGVTLSTIVFAESLGLLLKTRTLRQLVPNLRPNFRLSSDNSGRSLFFAISFDYIALYAPFLATAVFWAIAACRLILSSLSVSQWQFFHLICLFYHNTNTQVAKSLNLYGSSLAPILLGLIYGLIFGIAISGIIYFFFYQSALCLEI